jgi:hypothetical protein
VSAACGGGDPPPTEALWDRLVACELTGEFRVSEPTLSSCDAWPVAGERIEIVRDGDGAALRLGAIDVPIVGLDGCEVEAAGCSAVPALGSAAARYFSPTVRIDRIPTGIELEATAVDIYDAPRGRVGECAAGMTFTARPVAACDPEGRFVASAAAGKLGTCDLDWPAGEVSIARAADGTYDLDWSDTSIEGLVLDPSACVLAGDKGVGGSWSYNGAPRTTSITLTITGDQLGGTVMDALDGVTSDGRSCSGASFALAASRPSHPVAAVGPIAPTCEASRPTVCGDDTCEEGEDCTCADCACLAGAECTGDLVCRVPCTLLTEASDCVGGERCGVRDEDAAPRAVGFFEPLYCEPAGAGPVGHACERNADCAAGLLCHIPVGSWGGECSPTCGVGFPDCPADRSCGLLGPGDGKPFGDYNAQSACEREAQGGDCYRAACPPGQGCGMFCVGDDCDYRCSRGF